MADSFEYTPDEEAAIARRAQQYRNQQAFLDDLDAKAALEKSASDNAAAEAAARAMLKLRERQQQAAAAPRVRTKYEGPDPERASRGNFVSKEELADFQRKNPGATLRDLLNADRKLQRRGSPPPSTEAMRFMGTNRAAAPSSATDPRARGIRSPGANILERTEENHPAFLGLRLGDLRQSPADEARSTKIIRDEAKYRKGGKVKAYAKGGSVKGAGCEQRGLRKCKVY